MAEEADVPHLRDRPVDARLVARMVESPDGILERVAEDHGVSTFDVVRALPADHACFCDGARFPDVMADLAQWGDVLMIVHTPNIVLEVSGAIPDGSYGRGYFNLHGASPIGGHIRADRCEVIAFVSRPFMGRPSCSIQFFDCDGAAIFKIFVARDENRELVSQQVARFEALRLRTCDP